MGSQRLPLVLSLVALVVALLAFHQARRTGSAGETQPAYVPGLGEIMTAVQMRHAKLGVAGTAGNWELADYELDELDEGLQDAVTFHPTHKDMKQPLTELVPSFMKGPIEQMRDAVKAKDQARFDQGFAALTAGCNGCHEASEFGFNKVIRPAGPPMPNQAFSPAD